MSKVKTKRQDATGLREVIPAWRAELEDDPIIAAWWERIRALVPAKRHGALEALRVPLCDSVAAVAYVAGRHDVIQAARESVGAVDPPKPPRTTLH